LAEWWVGKAYVDKEVDKAVDRDSGGREGGG
jgi:hypothetical protein